MIKKDFNDFQKESENYTDDELKIEEVIDPNINISQSVIKEINYKNNYLKNCYLINYFLLTPLIAPLETIYVSLQISVKAHKNIYGQETMSNKSKLLMTQPKEITLQERRKYELLLKSGVTGTNKPYQAPVYEGYQDVINGLRKQGALGFYKGVFTGLLINYLSCNFKFKQLDSFNNERFAQYSKSKKEFMILGQGLQLIMFDLFLYPLQVIQTRFILQNRNEGFKLYKNVDKLVRNFRMKPKETFQGFSFMIPHSLLLAKSYDISNKLIQDSPIVQFQISHLVATFIQHPLMTVMRRMQAQSNQPGMINIRYSSAWHCFKLVIVEEGVKGLYNGIGAAFLRSLLISTAVARGTLITSNQFHNQY